MQGTQQEQNDCRIPKYLSALAIFYFPAAAAGGGCCCCRACCTFRWIIFTIILSPSCRHSTVWWVMILVERQNTFFWSLLFCFCQILFSVFCFLFCGGRWGEARARWCRLRACNFKFWVFVWTKTKNNTKNNEITTPINQSSVCCCPWLVK